jgi:dTDP-4-dehydrorhamnose reductase
MSGATQLALPAHPLFQRPPLVIGLGGMLYRAWAELLNARGIAHCAPSLDELDLTRPDSIHRWLDDRQPRLVINCAAYTDVDRAESEEHLATAINGIGVGDLAVACRDRDIHLVHYSTDYVFDGAASRPYPTDHPRRPLGAYGRSKALGEELIERAGGSFLIVRTSWLYAPWGKNFVRTIADLVRRGRPLKVVADQRGRPTSAENLARVTSQLMLHGATGTFHVTDGGECTWHQFAVEIGRRINPEHVIEPCTTAEFPRPAPRPPYSVLDISATETLVGEMMPWRTALAEVIGRLE